MARQRKPKFVPTIKDRAKANEANGQNVLNTLDFDVNTLIPQNDFNWEIVEGMDQIDQSIAQSYGKVASDIAKGLGKIEERIDVVDSNIEGSLDRQIATTESSINTLDTNLLTQMEIPLACMMDAYGNCISEVNWYVVLRETDGPYCMWTMEPTNSPPLGREAYGPYRDSIPLLVLGNGLTDLLPKRSFCQCPLDKNLQLTLNLAYQQGVDTLNTTYAGSWTEGSNRAPLTGNIYDKPFALTAGGLVQECVVNPPLPPIALCVDVPGGVYPYGTPIACPPGYNCTEIGRDANGKAYFVPEGSSSRIYLPCYDDEPPREPPVYPPNDPPITPPLPPKEPPSEPPVIPPIYPPVYPPTDKCPDPVIVNPVVCPPSSVTNVTNNYEQKEGEEINLDKLILTIQTCCENVTEALKGGKSGNGSSDLDFLYSEDGRARINSFLETNNLSEQAARFPNTLGDAIANLVAIAKREV